MTTSTPPRRSISTATSDGDAERPHDAVPRSPASEPVAATEPIVAPEPNAVSEPIAATDPAAAAEQTGAVKAITADPVAAAELLTAEDGASGPESADGRGPARTGNTVDALIVAEMFDAMTPVYDRVNTLMTLGTDARWRRRAAAETGLQAAGAVLDVCCGTGKLTALLSEMVGPFGRADGVDLSPVMIERATQTHRSKVQAHFQVADALALPFPDGEFDAATIAFGLRNLSDFEAGFRELRRVVRPGGRVVCLELSLPRFRAWARVFHATFRRAAPVAASLVGGRREAYRYLPASLEGFPSPEGLAALMRSAGLTDVRFWRLSTGVVALHRGTVPD